MNSQIIPNWPVPMYVQLARCLEAEAACLTPGGRLPSEHDLMNAYRVSRTTVRRALAVLERHGRVLRVHGSGTFVSDAGGSPASSPSAGE
ncbi:GntR family transcriptional regulator [Microbacterium sp. A84]|uniref:GntR family transcriptional regulator n=1 Tax=Microbacterium sp. A84 TaxID=3450715 RepID=UPI003F441459